MKRLRVYISGPLTTGDKTPQENIRDAEEAFHELRQAGFAPLCPHWSFFCEDAEEIQHDEWMAIDLAWVEVADAVLRLPGASVGAALECDYAAECGIPVFGTVAELEHWRGARTE